MYPFDYPTQMVWGKVAEIEETEIRKILDSSSPQEELYKRILPLIKGDPVMMDYAIDLANWSTIISWLRGEILEIEGKEEEVVKDVIRGEYSRYVAKKISGQEMGRFVRQWVVKRMDGEILAFLRMILTPLERYFEKIDRDDISDLLDQVHFALENFRTSRDD